MLEVKTKMMPHYFFVILKHVKTKVVEDKYKQIEKIPYITL